MAPGGKESFCCEYSEDRCQEPIGIGLNACAGSEVALGESRLHGSQASLNSNCQKTGESTFHFQRRNTLRAASPFNAFQQYEWLAGLAMAKLERRCPIIGLAHPPLCDNGANSLEIHDRRLLKSSASRQEKASACNRNCATADEHFCHDVVFDRCADVNAAWAEHLNSLLDDDGLTAGCETVAHKIGDGAAGGRAGGRIFSPVELHAGVPICCGI